MAQATDLIAHLEAMAPRELAASWDNTGLLVRGTREVATVGLCIDLTEPVLDELEAHEVDLVISYHPPIFRGLKRLTGHTGLERVLLRTVRSGRWLYAPHTALDAAPDGMGDWLAAALGPSAQAGPIEPDAVRPDAGMGRRGTLATPGPLRDLLPALKAHLGLAHVRVAGDLDAPRARFAVCPGAGGSLLADLTDVDLYLTGEMRHHDVLAKVADGAAVVLTDHTNTERGFLAVLARRLQAAHPAVRFLVSQVDADPLSVA